MSTVEDTPRVPQCVALIADGNRRWAREQGMSPHEGHRAGYERLKDIALWAKEAGVGTVVFWMFSTENWNRDEVEVEQLMSLFRFALEQRFEELREERIRFRWIGQRDRFPEDIQTLMGLMEEETKQHDFTVVLAASYGGRAELLSAAQSLIEEGHEGPLSEEQFVEHLWTKGIPDPDMIIRTGGELRLSGFLPWQSVYSELFFTKTYLPGLAKEEFLGMLREYATRDRRYGR